MVVPLNQWPKPSRPAHQKPAELIRWVQFLPFLGGGSQVISQLSGSDIKAAKDLIERNGLTFEEGFDEIFGIHDNGELIAVGARAGNILKMLAVEPRLFQVGPVIRAVRSSANLSPRLFQVGWPLTIRCSCSPRLSTAQVFSR